MSRISTKAHTNVSDEHDGAQDVRHAEVRRLRDDAAGHRSAEHRDALDDLALGEDRLELAALAK